MNDVNYYGCVLLLSKSHIRYTCTPIGSTRSCAFSNKGCVSNLLYMSKLIEKAGKYPLLPKKGIVYYQKSFKRGTCLHSNSYKMG